jgi:hypothetical protein
MNEHNRFLARAEEADTRWLEGFGREEHQTVHGTVAPSQVQAAIPGKNPEADPKEKITFDRLIEFMTNEGWPLVDQLPIGDWKIRVMSGMTEEGQKKNWIGAFYGDNAYEVATIYLDHEKMQDYEELRYTFRHEVLHCVAERMIFVAMSKMEQGLIQAGVLKDTANLIVRRTSGLLHEAYVRQGERIFDAFVAPLDWRGDRNLAERRRRMLEGNPVWTKPVPGQSKTPGKRKLASRQASQARGRVTKKAAA